MTRKEAKKQARDTVRGKLTCDEIDHRCRFYGIRITRNRRRMERKLISMLAGEIQAGCEMF